MMQGKRQCDPDQIQRPANLKPSLILFMMLAMPSFVLLHPHAVLTATQRPVGDAMRGKALYEDTCSVCHSIDQDRIGPHHRNIVGRRIASVAGFEYSPALKRLNGVWDEESLDKWLADPQSVAPGTTMGLQVEKSQGRADVIAYLKQVSIRSKKKKR